MIGYYCDKDKKFVATMLGAFNHPHEGRRTCVLCRRCQGMVYLKEQLVKRG